MRLWRKPWVHFLGIGVIFFGMDRWVMPHLREAPPRGVIHLSLARVKEVQLDFARQARRNPTPAQREALLRDVVDDEILFAEARRLQLDQGDESVRLRLVSKMRALGEGRKAQSEEELHRQARALGLDDDIVVRRHLIQRMRLLLSRSERMAPLSEPELLSYVERHKGEFEAPTAVSFSHVFLSSRSKSSVPRAEEQLNRFRSSKLSPEVAERWSDPFPLGLKFRSFSEKLLRSRFGSEFTKHLLTSPVGEWVGPFESPFGVHLVWVSEIEHAVLPPLEVIKPGVMRAIASERSEANFLEAIRNLRKLYKVKLESS